ncbi:hypothetical protein BGX24_003238, partial [Mortierella sp. AD032]
GGVEGAEFLDEMSDDNEDDTDEDTEDSDADEGIKVREGDTSDNEAEEEDDEGSDEDMFASDYEDKQAAKRTAAALKRGGSTKSSGGPFMFGADMMAFENGVSLVTSSSSSGASKEAQQALAFAMDHGKFKDILTQTFGAPSPQSSRTASKENAGEVELSEDDEDDENDMDDEKLKEYMSALDAELSATKVGESFEKTTANARSTPSSNKTKISTDKQDKGKEVPGKKAAAARKPEKNLEELMKEATARSRRGFNRHGPLGMSGPSFGYDPAGMSFADDEDDDDEDVESARKPRVSTIFADGEVGDELNELDDEEEEEEEMDQEMVDLDLNLAKNLLESFKSQGGLPGPGGNLLSRLGIVLPRDDDDDDNSDEDI